MPKTLLGRSAPLVLLALTLLAGCGKKIGDECGTNVDCSIAGDRFCDIAPVAGYCTVEGCDVDTCPDEAVCVRFYTPVSTAPCTYDAQRPRGDCAADERCLCDLSSAGECKASTAHCAPENSERRWCMKRCGNDGDCRGGYTCRATGTRGAEPVPSLEKPQGESASFCVSSGTS
jgi:hypothetical protein